ncbi:hypothetical protein TNCV_2525831 [Trichonephila clavipes]|nr:hypothetical protein TNCV_2525831 [Trichonephila clavipes]
MLEKVIENWMSRLDYIRASRGSPMPEMIFKMSGRVEQMVPVRYLNRSQDTVNLNKLKKFKTTKNYGRNNWQNRWREMELGRFEWTVRLRCRDIGQKAVKGGMHPNRYG